MLAVMVNLKTRNLCPVSRLLLTIIRSTLAALRASPLLIGVLVPGTVETYEQGGYRWDGNPWCYESGLLVQPGSEASTKQIGACYNVVKISTLAPAGPSGLELK